MAKNKTVFGIALAEIAIGSVTLLTNLASLLFSYNTKNYNVFIFVIATASVSFMLGVGLLNQRRAAYQLLIYFSSVVLLSKLLIAAGIISLDWTLETTLPASLKNSISLGYHAFIIFYLSQPNIKKLFIK